MNIKQDYIPDGLACDTHKNLTREPAFVTIHWVGPFPGQTPEMVRNHWIESNSEASAHVIIKDNDVLECWPRNKKVWHAGHTIGNNCSIGIEVIPEDTTGKFSDWSIQTLKAYLKAFYPNVPLVRHYDWTGKDCPAYYVNNKHWTELKEKLLKD